MLFEVQVTNCIFISLFPPIYKLVFSSLLHPCLFPTGSISSFLTMKESASYCSLN